jgi:hypothetical protein
MAFWLRDIPLDDEERLREGVRSSFTIVPRG